MTDDRIFTRREIFERGAVIAGAAGLAGLVSPTALAEASGLAPGMLLGPVQGGTLRFAVQGPPEGSLHPFLAPAYADIFRTQLVYEPLARRTNGVDRLLLVLAESMHHNKDGSQWTVRLRPGVKFHNGSTLTADDVVYTFEHAIQASPAFADGVNSGLFLGPGAVTAVNQHTVHFKLTQPVADFDERLSLRNDIVIVKAGDTESQLSKTSNGTGPFRLEKFNNGVSSSVIANSHYWNKGKHALPYLNGVEILVIADPNARINAVRGSLADYAIDLPDVAAKANKGSKLIKLVESGITAGGVNFFSINARVKPLNDNRVRLALKFACNRKQLVEECLDGFGVLGQDIICGGFADVDPKLKPRPYKPAKARSLLQQAGASGMKLTITEIGGFTAPGSSALYAEQLQKVGVDATVQTITLAQYAANFESIVQDGQMFALQGGNQPFAQAASIFMLSTSALNFWGWLRPAWDAKFKEAQAIFNTKRRNAAYAALQKSFYNEGGMVTWAFNPVINGTRTYAHGIEQHGYGYPHAPVLTTAWRSKKKKH